VIPLSLGKIKEGEESHGTAKEKKTGKRVRPSLTQREGGRYNVADPLKQQKDNKTRRRKSWACSGKGAPYIGGRNTTNFRRYRGKLVAFYGGEANG